MRQKVTIAVGESCVRRCFRSSDCRPVSFPTALRVSAINRQNSVAAGCAVDVGFATVVVSTAVVVSDTVVVSAAGVGSAASRAGVELYDGPPQPVTSRMTSAVPKLTGNDLARAR